MAQAPRPCGNAFSMLLLTTTVFLSAYLITSSGYGMLKMLSLGEQARARAHSSMLLRQASPGPGAALAGSGLGARQLLTLASWQKPLPRMTFAGKRVPGRFCGADASDTCKFVEYAQSLALFAIPGVLFAVLTLIGTCVFFVLRLICGAFGGWKASYGCCKAKPIPFPGYSGLTLAATKTLFFVAVGCVVAAGVCCTIANMGISSGVLSFVDELLATVTKVKFIVLGIIDALEAISYTANSAASLTGVISAADSLQSRGRSLRATVKSYDFFRWMIVNALIGVPVLVTLLSMISPLCSMPKASFACVMALTILLFASWFLFSLHFVLAVLLSDLCVELDTIFVPGKEISPLLRSALSCKQSNESSFYPLVTKAREGLDQAASTACSAFSSLCTGEVPCVQARVACDARTVEQLVYQPIVDFVPGCFVNETIGTLCSLDASKSCTGLKLICDVSLTSIIACSNSCMNGDLRQLTKDMLQAVNDLAAYRRLLETQIVPLTECTFVVDLFRGVHRALCVEFFGGIDGLATGNLLLNLMLYAVQIMLILGFKRFVPLSKARVDLYNSVTADEEAKAAAGAAADKDDGAKSSGSAASRADGSDAGSGADAKKKSKAAAASATSAGDKVASAGAGASAAPDAAPAAPAAAIDPIAALMLLLAQQQQQQQQHGQHPHEQHGEASHTPTHAGSHHHHHHHDGTHSGTSKHSARDRPRPGSNGQVFLVSSYSSDDVDNQLQWTVLEHGKAVDTYRKPAKPSKAERAALKQQQQVMVAMQTQQLARQVQQQRAIAIQQQHQMQMLQQREAAALQAYQASQAASQVAAAAAAAPLQADASHPDYFFAEVDVGPAVEPRFASAGQAYANSGALASAVRASASAEARMRDRDHNAGGGLSEHDDDGDESDSSYSS